MKTLLPILALVSLGVAGALMAASNAKIISKHAAASQLPRVMDDVPCPTPTPPDTGH